MPGAAITACILARNEARRIEAAIQSLLGWTDQLIVLDNESEDATAAHHRQGDGWSTLAWGWYSAQVGGKVTTIDLAPEHLQVCRRMTSPYASAIEYVESDSVAFLRRWKKRKRRPIHLLYLDSVDHEEPQKEASEEHQRREAEAALPSLAPRCLVLIDDTSLAGEPGQSGSPTLTGKGARAVPFLLERGFRIE